MHIKSNPYLLLKATIKIKKLINKYFFKIYQTLFLSKLIKRNLLIAFKSQSQTDVSECFSSFSLLTNKFLYILLQYQFFIIGKKIKERNN